MTARQGKGKAKSVATAAPAIVDAAPEGSLVLTAHCTLREAVAMKAQLLERLDTEGDVEIDAGVVEKIDTAGLQLLVAFSRQLNENNRALAWKSVTGELQGAAAQLGLVATLGLPAAEAAL